MLGFDGNFDWTHRAYHTNQWVIIAARHLFDDMIVANPRPESLSLLALIDPGGTAGPQERVALEHGASALAVDLARLHSVEEAELRLGRDLVDELLVEHPDERRVLSRAQVLGYDLQRPHRVVVVDCESAGSETALVHDRRRRTQPR